jgi:hypothetical protein
MRLCQSPQGVFAFWWQREVTTPSPAKGEGRRLQAMCMKYFPMSAPQGRAERFEGNENERPPPVGPLVGAEHVLWKGAFHPHISSPARGEEMWVLVSLPGEGGVLKAATVKSGSAFYVRGCDRMWSSRVLVQSGKKLGAAICAKSLHSITGITARAAKWPASLSVRRRCDM